MESVLVTGGAGFIGSNIAEALTGLGYRVVIVDDLSTGRMENILEIRERDSLKFIKGSILDGRLLRTTVREENISLICHQAAVPSVSKSIKDPMRTMEVNTTGTATVLQVAAECRCKRVVFASSSSVYGDTPELPKQEDMSLNPKSPYAVSKVSKEMLAGVFSSLYDVETVGLRYFNVYGRKQDPASDYAAVIPKFIFKALRNEDITIEGDGLQTRDFSYIDDVVAANISALTSKNIPRKVFNIAYGERISVMDLAGLIKESTGSASRIVYLPARPGDVRDSLADVGFARRHLSFAPQFNIRNGLAETIAWYRDHAEKRCAA